MKTRSQHFIAAAVSAMLMISAVGTFFVSAETETQPEQTVFTLNYDFVYDGAYCKKDGEFEPSEHSYPDIFEMSTAVLYHEDYYFNGWTLDDIHLIEPGDIFSMPKKDATLKAVWTPKDAEPHIVSYSAFFDDAEHIDFEHYPRLQGAEYYPGQCLQIATLAISRDGYSQIGWTDGVVEYPCQTKIIMPDHDVTLEPSWHKYYSIRYDAGDVDRVNGDSAYVFDDRLEGMTFDLASSDRLSRSGFKLVGWHCDYDDQIYKIGSYYVMPAKNVTFYAVWEAKSYNVVFKSTSGKQSESIKVTGLTDEAIICPETTLTNNGYVFAGWKFDGDDTIYKPGDEFVIPGALPGIGIQLKSVWMTQEEYDAFIASESINSLDLALARKQYAAGEITEDELKEMADFILGR